MFISLLSAILHKGTKTVLENKITNNQIHFFILSYIKNIIAKI